MKKNKSLLDNIIKAEAKEAEWGLKAKKLRDQYVVVNCSFKTSDYLIDNENFLYSINDIIFHTSPYGFKYYVTCLKKDFSLKRDSFGKARGKRLKEKDINIAASFELNNKTI